MFVTIIIVLDISIHAPRAGSDQRGLISVNALSSFQSTLPVRGATDYRGASVQNSEFQSTLPVRGATGGVIVGYWIRKISIHAPRAGSDVPVLVLYLCDFISIHAPRAGSDPYIVIIATIATYFNPRSPCGERPAPRLSITYRA